MKRTYSSIIFILFLLFLKSGGLLSAVSADDNGELTYPAHTEVRNELESWVKTAAPQAAEEALKKWDTDASDVFGKTVAAMRSVSPAVQNYLQQCDALAWQELPFGQKLELPHLPIQVYLDGSTPAKYLKNALRYYLAQRLVQARLDDEALLILDELTAENNKEHLGLPALLIMKAVVCEHLALPEKGLAALEEFKNISEKNTAVPRRYIEMAKLLEFSMKKEQEELEKKQMENLQQMKEHTSKQMDDIRRRLGKGRTDEDTQEAEKDVMKNIDKLIEKVEKQLQQKEQQENSQGEQQQGQQANKPADDSKRMQQKAPGNVDRRDFDKDTNWGNLPPKEREEALLKIEKEFPAHYRDIIEQYFREMAGKGNN